MVGMFPSVLLVHSVKVHTRATLVVNGATTEVTSLDRPTVACLISEVSSSRGQNDHDGAVVVEAVLTGTSSLLGTPNVWFEVVKGPLPAGTMLFPAGGQSPHGAAGGIRQFYRFRVSTVVPG